MWKICCLNFADWVRARHIKSDYLQLYLCVSQPDKSSQKDLTLAENVITAKYDCYVHHLFLRGGFAKM